MTLAEALSYVRFGRTDATGMRSLVVDNLEAAEFISAYLNMEEGSGALRGPFLEHFPIEDNDEEVEQLEVYEVQLLMREQVDSDESADDSDELQAEELLD